MSNEDPKDETPHAASEGGVQWREGDVPVSRRFDDSYYSDADGRGETSEVFLAGNGLPARWRGCQQFTIGELGFGTGLNFFETVAQWTMHARSGAQLHYATFEAFPLPAEDMERALGAWSDLQARAAPLLAQWPPQTEVFQFVDGPVQLTLYAGDARDAIRAMTATADAWYLDGFSPAKNPELWEAELLRAVYERTAVGGTFSTYTAAGWVRRNLEAAGFDVERVTGFGRKRERLQGMRPAAAP